jgi:FkbM family methyltransferase
VGNSREPELAVLDRFVRPAATVIDIGAHKGVYTHWLSRRVGSGGRVLAYEPQPELHRYLLAGLATRWYRNVLLSDVALSDHPGTAPLTIPVVSGEQQIAWASLETGSGIDLEVRTSRLDDEVRERAVSFVKCDVEGRASKVLDGAARRTSRRSAVC